MTSFGPFDEHVPYAVEEDRTYRASYWRWVCKCGERGLYVADQERAHDGHREHVARALRRCPRCMAPLLGVPSDDGSTRWACPQCRQVAEVA